MDKKKYKLDNVDIIQFVADALAVFETIPYNIIQYKVLDSKKSLE